MTEAEIPGLDDTVSLWQFDFELVLVFIIGSKAWESGGLV